MCDKKRSCSYPLRVGPVPPFGDPCPGIAKYLEVKYQCIPPPTPPTIGPPKKKIGKQNHVALDLLDCTNGNPHILPFSRNGADKMGYPGMWLYSGDRGGYRSMQ
jgi:hypothetical protein